MNRTITQIAVSSGDHDTQDVVYALCADGTLWQRVIWEGHGWMQIPPIPADSRGEPE